MTGANNRKFLYYAYVNVNTMTARRCRTAHTLEPGRRAMNDDSEARADAAIPDALAEDCAALTEQAEALRRAGRRAAADQLLAWRDLHLLRHSAGR